MRERREVFFVDGVRTAFGRAGEKGVFWRTRADDMGVKVVRELLRRNPQLDPERIGDVILAAEDAVVELGLAPKLRLVAYAYAGVEPHLMGIGPVPATRRVLEQTTAALLRQSGEAS